MEKVVYSRILVATQLLLFVLGLSGLSACRLGEASLSGNLTSIYGSDPDQNSNTETLVVETASGGSGTAIDTLNLVVGESTEFFSVMRKSSGEFVADAEVSWVLNGGIGTLTIDPSGQSAQFNAIAVGTGQVKAYTGGLSFIVDLNVTLPPLPTISFTSSAQSVTEGSDIVNGPEWYAGPGYTHRVRLTFDNSAQSENLNDFPVMVKLNSGRIDYLNTKDAGEDVRFYDSSGTPLSFEIESWSESGDSIIWVKVPLVAAGSNTDYIWMFYGADESVSASNPALVWNADIASVFHFSGTGNDSTANAKHATSVAPSYSSGSMGNSAAVSGFDSSFTLPNGMTATLPLTISGWFKTTSNGTIFSASNVAYPGTPSKWAPLMYIGTDYKLRGAFYSGTFPSYASPTAVNDDLWHHVAFVATSTGQKFYLDGVLLGTFGVPQADYVSMVYNDIGKGSTYLWPQAPVAGWSSFSGSLDEFRVATVEKSADWLKAEHLSGSDTFITYGPPETSTIGLTSASVDISVSSSHDEDIVIPITVSGSASSPNDYAMAETTSITIPAGQTSYTVNFDIVQDLAVEGDETVTLTLGDPGNAYLGTDDSFELTISDDDTLAEISVADVTRFEGQTFTVEISLNQPIYSGNVEVDYTTSNGTAEIPGDYTAKSGTAVFGVGITSVTVQIPTFTDMTDEGSEVFQFNLSNPVNGVLADASATLQLDNNFAPVTVNDGPIIVNTSSSSHTVLGNDTDPDGDLLIVSTAESASGGIVSVSPTNIITYTPPVGYSGIETITYEANDQKGGVTPGTLTLYVMTPYTWTGAAANSNFSDGGNWCGNVVSNACQGDMAAPNGSQKAIFDGTCTSNCDATIGSTTSLGGLHLNEGYSGTITQGVGVDLTVGALGYMQAGGSFIGSSDAGDDLNVYTYSTPNIIISGGTFRAPRGIFTIRYGFVVSAVANFVHNNGLLRTVGDCGCSYARGRIELNGDPLYNFDDNRSWGFSDHIGTTVVEGDYIFNLGGYGTRGNIELHGDLTVLAQSNSYALSSITLAGSGDQTITHTAGAFPRYTFIINKPSGNVVLASNLTMTDASQTVNLLSGQILLGGYTWSIAGNLVLGASQTVDLGGGSLSTKTLNLNSGSIVDLNGGTLTVNGSPVVAGPYGSGSVTD
ncbi:MAG: DUF2341 domain-containing protein [Bdellovibrionales bacterium]|nr:DUF2341 domain-containing protein [Bdellovibrionales bacterium]